MNNNGWIKLHRKLMEWEWYKTSNMVHVFIHFLLLANHKSGKWQGQEIQRGQFITGRKQLSAQMGLSEQVIRTCITRLKSTNEITIKTTNHFSLITICNFLDYQDEEPIIQPAKSKLINQPLTSNQPAINQQLTTNNNDKNEENDNNEKNMYMCMSDFDEIHIPEPIEKPVKSKRKKPEFIPPTEDEFIEYFRVNSYNTDIAKRAFKGYSESGWKDSQGKPVLNWKQKCQHVWFKPEHKSKHKSREQEIKEFERGAEQYRKDGWDVVN
jgi:hypothetical protein